MDENPLSPTEYHKSNYKVNLFNSNISATTFLAKFIPLPSSFCKGQQ